MGKQAPPARAAPSLAKALRSASGSLLFATWTSSHRRLPAAGVPAVPRGVGQNGVRDRLADKSLIQRRALAGVIPGDAGLIGPSLPSSGMVAAVIVDQVRRVGGEQDRPLPVHHPDHVVGFGRVTAQQPVCAQQPQVTDPRDRLGRWLGDEVLAGRRIVVTLFIEYRQQPVDLVALETGQPQVEPVRTQRLQFSRQQLFVPAGQLGEPVVGNSVGAELLRAQMRQPAAAPPAAGRARR